MLTSTSKAELRSSQFALLWLLAFATSSALGAHGIAYWDAGDYVLLALEGGQSGLLLGRPMFLWVSRLVLAAGVEPSQAEPVLRWFWAAAGATAASALALLAARLGLDRRAAIAAGAALALSPSFAHASHQVLTDAPALALSIVGLVLAAGGRATATGLVLAAAIASRETAAIHLVAAALLLGRRRAPIAVATCAAAIGAVILVSRPPGLASWFTHMSQSAATHPLSAADVGMSLLWVLAAGPAPVALGIYALARGGQSARVRAVAWPALVATLLLVFYPDGSFSPRYALAAVPIAFFLLAAPLLAARPGVAAIALLVPLGLAFVAARPAAETAARGATLTTRIPALPEAALVVPGHFCPQARVAAAVARRVDLEFVCPGWTWPADVGAVLDDALARGRPVAVDVADAAWIGRREIAPRDAVRAWAGRQTGREVAGFVVIARRPSD